MSYRKPCARQLVALIVVAGALLATTLFPGAAAVAAPPAAPVTVTVEIEAIEDIGVIESVPTFTGGGAPYFVLNARPGGDFDWNFVRFDLSALPATATIDSAQFRLYVNASANPLDIEMGRVDGAWSEATTSWNSKPAVTWPGAIRNAPAVGNVDWPIKPLLDAWLAGTQTNYGIALRGLTPATGGVRADTRDGGIAPRLVVTYTVPVDDGARPDFGDAPDSSNHHGAVNSAYAGVPGRFPSVWEGTAAGQPAGPRHANQSMEGWLGDFISREADADIGLDQDGPNNILRGAGGAVGDIADNDRGDDGWRNRQIKFFDCRRTTLDMRVSKAPGATRNFLYLNVWFDGNRDGDWEDISPCQPDETGPAQASYEWIVQNYIVDMTAVPAGGSLDFAVNTEKVLNSTPGERHWMRFTLSETPAVQPSGALADGRGPHPSASPDSYQVGETEDVFQVPPPPGQDGTLDLQKRVITTSEPTEWIDYVTYEIRLRNNGGTQPVQAQIRDVLPYPLIVYPTIDGSGVHYVTVTSATGGATPLLASLDVKTNPAPNPPQQVVSWQGIAGARRRGHADVQGARAGPVRPQSADHDLHQHGAGAAQGRHGYHRAGYLHGQVHRLPGKPGAVGAAADRRSHRSWRSHAPARAVSRDQPQPRVGDAECLPAGRRGAVQRSRTAARPGCRQPAAQRIQAGRPRPAHGERVF